MLTNGKKASTIVLNSWISREVMEKEQGKLIIIVSVVFAMVLLCARGKVITGMYAGSSQRPG